MPDGEGMDGVREEDRDERDRDQGRKIRDAAMKRKTTVELEATRW